MTPTPQSSPDGSQLPPRHRPNMGNLAKDTTELDLWAFDDIDAEAGEPPAAVVKPADPVIPISRGSEKKERKPKDPVAPKGESGADLIKVNVGKVRPKAQAGPLAGQSKPGSDFDDLDHWDEPEVVVPELKEPPAPVEPVAPEPAPVEERDEFAAVVPENASPVSLRPKLGLTRIERIGLGALLAVLVIGGILVFLNTISRLPTEAERVGENDFPIRGKHLAVVSADSYWRAPREGDTARRGTQLLPVVNFSTSGGAAALRVFFRNSDGDVVGDAVTRAVRSGAKVQVAATAGFDDVGMHAAYRTGQSKPWIIEVFEAPDGNASGADFKKLFEMNISTDRR